MIVGTDIEGDEFEREFLRDLSPNKFTLTWRPYEERWKRILFGSPSKRRINTSYYLASATVKDGTTYPTVVFIRKDSALKINPHLKWLEANEPEHMAKYEIRPQQITSVNQFSDRLPAHFVEEINETRLNNWIERIAFVLTMRDINGILNWGEETPLSNPGWPSPLNLPPNFRLYEVEHISLTKSPSSSDSLHEIPANPESMKMCYY